MVFLRQIFTTLFCFFSLLNWGQEVETQVGNYTFFQNKGQWPNGVLYRAKLPAGNIWLEQGRILYQFMDYSELHESHASLTTEIKEGGVTFKQDIVATKFIGSNTKVKTETQFPASYYQNYFLGNDKSHWASNVKGYHHVTYKNLYQDIDLLVFEKEYELKYEFHVAPNADPNQIEIEYEGHKKMRLTRGGNLIVYSEIGEIHEKKPYAYQIKNGRIVEVPCQFILKEEQLTYALGEYDKEIELIIDPELIFATYSGSETDNFGMTATFANDGKGYSGGTIYGNTYPTPGPAWNTIPSIDALLIGAPTTDVFVSKYSEDGTTMLWTNFIGGGDNTQGTETVHSLICDKEDNVYLYGATSSIDFPNEGGYQVDHAGGDPLRVAFNGTDFGMVGTDIYIAKFSSNGLSLMGATYVGGSANDGVNFKISSGIYASSAAYDSLTTNYGDQFRGEIMLDSLNNILVTSSSWSTNFPVESGFQMSNAGKQDAVLFKMAADFSSMVWSSYYGGSDNDAGYSVKIDSSYNVVFAGGTTSSNLPNTTGGIQEVYGGGKADGFISKVNSTGSTVMQATYIGTTSYDQIFFVEIDRWDNIFIVGQSLGAMPVSADVYSDPGSSQFIWKLNPMLSVREYSTVFGNGENEINISPSAFLVDLCGNVYVSGWGGNILPGGSPTDGMPTTSDAYIEESPNFFDFYMIVLERDAESLLYGTYMGGDQADEHVDGGTSRFDKFGVVYQSVCGGCGGFSDFPVTPDAWSTTNDAWDPPPMGTIDPQPGCNNILYKFDFEIVPLAKFEVALLEGCAPLTLTFDNESNDTINFNWNFGAGADVLSGGVSPVVLFDEAGTYEVVLTITDTICGLTDSAVKVITVYDELQLEVPNDTIVCSSITYDLLANSYGTAIEFQWSDDPTFGTTLNDGPMDSVITVSPTTTTTYYVTATNGWELCDLVDSVVVAFVDGGIEIKGDTTICLADTTVLSAENLFPDIEITFDWGPDEFLIAESDGVALALPTGSMAFYLTAITDMGCVIKDSVFVNVQEVDSASIYATATPDLVPEGGTTTLEAFPVGYNYTWIPTVGVTNPLERVTTATVDQNTKYTVIMTDGICNLTADVLVTTYEFICGDTYVFVPNAFSPNGDGQNDQLFVRGQNLEEITFKVFDRWGELVFETTDQIVGWDGRFKGKPVDPDVYVYHLQVVCFDGQENLIKGNVTVLK